MLVYALQCSSLLTRVRPCPAFDDKTAILIVSTIATPLCIAFFYIRTKLNIRSVYESGPVPELITSVTGVQQGFVQLSSLDVLVKSYLVISLLALHIAYCAWRFPDEAVCVRLGLL